MLMFTHLSNVHTCTCMVLTTPVEMHAHSPQKMHMHSCMRAHAAVQKLLCHESYHELILSLVRASCRLSFAARPACCLDEIGRPTLFAQEIRPNPQEIRPNPQLMTRPPLRCRTSIIRSSALVQALSSLSMSRTRAWPRGSLHQKFYFRHLFAQVWTKWIGAAI